MLDQWLGRDALEMLGGCGNGLGRCQQLRRPPLMLVQGGRVQDTVWGLFRVAASLVAAPLQTGRFPFQTGGSGMRDGPFIRYHEREAFDLG